MKTGDDIKLVLRLRQNRKQYINVKGWGKMNLRKIADNIILISFFILSYIIEGTLFSKIVNIQG